MIKLGYEIETGKEVGIKNSHLIVTGLTQEAGKTTTLEALIKRSGKRAIVFKTKIGEKSFLEGTMIPPYFKDKSDWQFVQGLIEATIKEKMRTFERAKIIQLCKKTSGKSLLEFKKKVDERLLEKINGFEMDILTNIQAYLEIVLPKLQSINFSKELQKEVYCPFCKEDIYTDMLEHLEEKHEKELEKYSKRHNLYILCKRQHIYKEVLI